MSGPRTPDAHHTPPHSAWVNVSQGVNGSRRPCLSRRGWRPDDFQRGLFRRRHRKISDLPFWRPADPPCCPMSSPRACGSVSGRGSTEVPHHGGSDRLGRIDDQPGQRATRVDARCHVERERPRVPAVHREADDEWAHQPTKIAQGVHTTGDDTSVVGRDVERHGPAGAERGPLTSPSQPDGTSNSE